MNKDKDKDKEAEKIVLDKLKQKRSTIKAITTRLLNKINDIIIDENADVMDLEEAREHLIQKEAELIKLDEEIETAIQDLDELDKDIEKSREYRDRITSVKFKINKILKRANEQAEKLVINSEDKVNKTTDLPSGSEHKNRARLPKLSIGLYDGNPETFTEFWSQFKSAIHENDTLSKIDKFSYLKSLLTGSAAVALKGLLISETNYDISIGILEQRYGRKDILVRAHVNNLLNLNPVRNVYNIKELRDLYDSCEVQIRNLEALGVELSSYGNLLFPMLMKLIPNSLVLEFNKDKKEEEAWDVRVFLKFFKAEIENRERTMMFNKKYDEETQGRYSAKPVVNKYTNPNSLKVTSDKRTGEKINKKIPSAYALNTSVNNTCLFCEGCSDHTIEACIKPVTEKKNALKAQGRCYSCLGRSHVSRFCFKRIKCKQCNGNHSELICERANPSNKINTPNDSSGKDTAVSSLQSVPDRKQICLQSLKVTAAGIRGRRDVRCLCDSGSQRTFILETVSKALHLKILGEERITIYSFGSKDPVIEKRKRVQLVLRDSQQPKRKIVIEALETPSISGAQISTPGKEIRNYCRRENLRLADGGGNSKDLEISVLIGSDNYWKVVTGRIHRISRSLVLCQTIFGWVVNGTSGSSETSTNQSVVNVMKSTTSNVDTDCDVKNLLRDFWSLEKLGIEPENDNNITDEHILDEFNQNIKFKGDRYEVKLPWNERVGELGDNYEVALSRLNSLAKRFVRNPELHERYKGVIAEYLEKGIVEEASENADSKLYYIPHQPILREDKLTTKLRIVFDASSHVDGVVSLNQCLNAGPNLTPDLLAILLKFRLHRVAFIGDIEQAFLQILIAKEERDALRFLWINGPIGAHNQFSLQIMRSTRVMFGVTSSPFLLSATIKFHIDKYKLEYPNEFELLNNYLYVDDLVSGEDGENER